MQALKGLGEPCKLGGLRPFRSLSQIVGAGRQERPKEASGANRKP